MRMQTANYFSNGIIVFCSCLSGYICKKLPFIFRNLALISGTGMGKSVDRVTTPVVEKQAKRRNKGKGVGKKARIRYKNNQKPWV